MRCLLRARRRDASVLQRGAVKLSLAVNKICSRRQLQWNRVHDFTSGSRQQEIS